MIKPFFAFIFLLIGCYSFGQNQIEYEKIEVDSLLFIWKDKKQTDSTRLHALGFYSWRKFVFSQPDSAFYYADIQHNLAKKLGLKKYVAFALSTKGTAFWVKGDYSKSLSYFQENLEVSKEVGKKSVIASVYNKLGIVYGSIGDEIKQIDYYEKSLKLREDIGDKSAIATTLSNIAGLHQEQKNYAKALEYHQKCLKIREELNEQAKIAWSSAHIGEIYLDHGDYKTALTYYERSLKLGKEFGDKKEIAWYIELMGDYFRHKKDYTKALEYYQRSLQHSTEMGAKPEISSVLFSIGAVYLAKKQYSKTIEKCKESYQIAVDINDVSRQNNACECLYEGYKGLNNSNQALNFFEKASVLNDSLKSEETAKRLQEMEFAKIILKDSIAKAEERRIAKEKIRKQESKIALLNTKNKVKSLWIIFGSLAAILLMGLLYYRYKQRVKYKDLQNKLLNSEIEYKKKDLTNFAVNISNNQEWALSLAEKMENLKTSTGRKRAKELEDLDTEIKNKIWVDKSSDDFYKKIDALSSSFYAKLNTQFEGLTKTEIRLCSLIKLELDNKQIASLQNINPSSVKKSRNRLRKKLNLSPQQDLDAFLRTF
ncbi:MAG: tetratricopeptide repeat protein [Flavobacteriaceae bacterium]